jgi:hypothetical protein
MQPFPPPIEDSGPKRPAHRSLMTALRIFVIWAAAVAISTHAAYAASVAVYSVNSGGSTAKEPKRPDEDKGETVGAKTPRWRNILIENGRITDCPNSVIIWGLPEQPITGVTLRNLRISAQRGATIYHAKDVRFENVVLRAETGAALTTFNAVVAGMAATPFDAPGAQP